MNTPNRRPDRRRCDSREQRDREQPDLEQPDLESRDVDSPDLESRVSDNQEPDNQDVDGQGIDNQDTDSHDIDSHDIDSRGAGRHVADGAAPALRILVVEDEGLIALNLELMLHRFGCEIIGPVSRVDDIVGAARAHRPDGAFLDVNLRGRKVFDVLPEMIGLGVPCVLSSGYDDPMLFPAAWRDLPRIAKPFDEDELQRACAEFGALAAARQAQAAGAAAAPSRPGDEPGQPAGEAVVFRRRRRFAPARPAGEEHDEPRAAAGGRR